ncbi:MAG: hypothetical protein WCI05_18860 [Myxococcales bacterium]
MRMVEMGAAALEAGLAAMNFRKLVGLLLMLAGCNTLLGCGHDPVLVEVDSGGGSDTGGSDTSGGSDTGGGSETGGGTCTGARVLARMATALHSTSC